MLTYRRPLAPEMRLMIAVREEAVHCIGKFGCAHAVRHGHQFEDALEWVLSDSTEQQLFTFQCICDTLGLDATYLRRGLSVAMSPEQGHSTVTRPPGAPGDGQQVSSHVR